MGCIGRAYASHAFSFDLLYFLELGLDGIGAIGEVLYGVVTEEDGINQVQAEEDAHGQLTYLGLGMGAGPHLDEMPPGASIARSDDRGFCLIGQNRAGALLDLLTQIGAYLCTENADAGLLHFHPLW